MLHASQGKPGCEKSESKTTEVKSDSGCKKGHVCCVGPELLSKKDKKLFCEKMNVLVDEANDGKVDGTDDGNEDVSCKLVTKKERNENKKVHKSRCGKREIEVDGICDEGKLCCKPIKATVPAELSKTERSGKFAQNPHVSFAGGFYLA